MGWETASEILKETNNTKYFVIRWFDEVCSEYNEVNEEAESKRHEQEK